MTDEQYIVKYKETEDVKYVSQLYKKYMTLVYGSCLKYFKNESDAQDAVMDIYEKLTKKVLTSDIQNFNAWLFMVTRNHCIEVLRKENRHSDKKSSAELMYSEEVFHPDTVQDEQIINLLRQCLDELETFQKECIKMFYYQKMSYIEIGDQLELAYNQVRSRIQNGRRNLKRCIDLKSPSTTKS